MCVFRGKKKLSWLNSFLIECMPNFYAAWAGRGWNWHISATQFRDRPRLSSFSHAVGERHANGYVSKHGPKVKGIENCIYGMQLRTSRWRIISFRKEGYGSICSELGTQKECSEGLCSPRGTFWSIPPPRIQTHKSRDKSPHCPPPTGSDADVSCQVLFAHQRRCPQPTKPKVARCTVPHGTTSCPQQCFWWVYFMCTCLYFLWCVRCVLSMTIF